MWACLFSGIVMKNSYNHVSIAIQTSMMEYDSDDLSPMGHGITPWRHRVPSSGRSQWQNRWYWGWSACRRMLRESVPRQPHRTSPSAAGMVGLWSPSNSEVRWNMTYFLWNSFYLIGVKRKSQFDSFGMLIYLFSTTFFGCKVKTQLFLVVKERNN